MIRNRIAGFDYMKIEMKYLFYIVEGDSKAPFLLAITPRCRGRRYFFPRTVPLYLDLNAEC